MDLLDSCWIYLYFSNFNCLQRFFDIILTYGIWDADPSVREESVAAIAVALSVGTTRESKEPSEPPW